MNIREIFKQSSFNLIGQLLNIVISFLYIPLLNKYLDDERFGLYFLFFSFIGYYNLLDLGLTQGIIKSISKYDSLKKYDKFNEILSSALLFFSLFFLIMFLLINFNKDIILNSLNVNKNYINESKQILTFVSISFSLSFIYSIFSSTFQAILRFDISNLLNISSLILVNFSSIILIIIGYSLKEIFFIHNIVLIIFIIISFVLLKRLKPFIKFNISNFLPNVKELLSFSFFVFISKISNSLNTNVIPLFISYFHSPSLVPFFFVPLKLMNIASILISSFGNTIFPVTSILNESKDFTKIQKIFKISYKLIINFLTPIYFSLFFASYSILSLWMGKEFAEKSYQVLSLLSLSFFFSSFTVIPSTILLGLGKSRFIGFYSFTLTIVSILFNLILIKDYSYKGAAYANILVSLNSFLFIYLSKKRIFTNEKENHKFKFNVNLVLLSLIFSLGIISFLFSYYKISVYFHIILIVLISFLYYLYLLTKKFLIIHNID